MRILFDQGTPVPLRRAMADHEVTTVFELGWSDLANGDLLREAETKYDLLITTDQNLRYQQNLAGRHIAILVLPTANWLQLRSHARQIAAVAVAMIPGKYLEFTILD